MAFDISHEFNMPSLSIYGYGYCQTHFGLVFFSSGVSVYLKPRVLVPRKVTENTKVRINVFHFI